jgi:hypothetical protein
MSEQSGQACKPRIDGIEYTKDEWWNGSLASLDEAYSELAGLLAAREELVSRLSSGDLRALLASADDRDLVLRIVVGGMKEECLSKPVSDSDVRNCFKENSIAAFYRDVLGIGMEYQQLAKFLNRWRQLGPKDDVSKAGEDIRFSLSSGSGVVELLNEIKRLLAGAYGHLQRKLPEAKRIEVKRAEDLPDSFRDFLNDAVNLLPLYNRFTFFIQSLNFTPKVYLKLMYCDDLFGERAQDLMNRHGIRLIPKLQSRIWKGVSELDDDFTIIGHAPNSFGDYLVKVIHNIYKLTHKLSELYRGGIGVKINDELAKYIKQYSHYLDPLHRELIGGELPSYAYYGTYLVIITRDDGTLILNDVANRSKYTSYLGL